MKATTLSTSTSIRRRPRIFLQRSGPWLCAALWGLLVLPLLPWGLPTSRNDSLLFGGDPPWAPERYAAARALRELRERNAGADTDLDPIQDRSQFVELTRDAAHRGEVLLRYRLYSHQPDEMITFRALQRMQPRQFDFDPRLYQYGGGYIYLVGAALGASAATGLVHITGDLDVYLASPELFGRFYLVARAISVAFGGLALVAVFRLAAAAGGRFAGWAAFLLVASSPVFLSGALEAKPHLPAAAMGLWAIIFGLRWLRARTTGGAILLGASAGYAFGLVLTGAAALLTVVAAWLAARTRGKCGARGAAVALAMTLGIFCITNPYVPINAITNPAALASNVTNSTAMYSIAHFGEGAVRVVVLLEEAIGWAGLLAGLAGVGWLIRRHALATAIAGAAGVGLLVLCAAIGAGKPAEFARFLALPAALLCIAAGCGAARVAKRSQLAAATLVTSCVFVSNGWKYCYSFWADGLGQKGSRQAAAAWLAQHAGPDEAIGVLQEPAPYCVPPLDFGHRRVVLLPSTPAHDRAGENLTPWLVCAGDAEIVGEELAQWTGFYELAWEAPANNVGEASPITWANKSMLIFRLRHGR